MKMMPELDISLCDGCGLCVIACHGGSIIKDGDKVLLDADNALVTIQE